MVKVYDGYQSDFKSPKATTNVDSNIAAIPFLLSRSCLSRTVDIPIAGLNLAAMACVLLAAKWEEREEDVPLLSHLTQVCGDRYTVKELQLMEMVILDFLGWNGERIRNCIYKDIYMCVCVIELRRMRELRRPEKAKT